MVVVYNHLSILLEYLGLLDDCCICTRIFTIAVYLIEGNTGPNPTDHPVPFIIEWTPNVLPNSQVGELRIKFEFSHSRNGQTDQRRIESRSSLIGPDDLRS